VGGGETDLGVLISLLLFLSSSFLSSSFLSSSFLSSFVFNFLPFSFYDSVVRGHARASGAHADIDIGKGYRALSGGSTHHA
jgi:hypothetical protein